MNKYIFITPFRIENAQWTAVPYSVTYDGNNSTSGNVPVDPSSPYIYNSLVSVLGNDGTPAVLARTRYTFTNWNTSADGFGTSYFSGSAFYITSLDN